MTGAGPGGHRVDSVNPFPNANPGEDFNSKYHLPNNVNPETGHFIHLPPGVIHRVMSTIPFHVIGGPTSTIVNNLSQVWTVTARTFIPGSHIFALPFAATATIGIEHVPEPAAPILLLGGVACMACGFRARRRRQQLA